MASREAGNIPRIAGLVCGTAAVAPCLDLDVSSASMLRRSLRGPCANRPVAGSRVGTDPKLGLRASRVRARAFPGLLPPSQGEEAMIATAAILCGVKRHVGFL